MEKLHEMHPTIQLDKVLECLQPDMPPIHRALEIVDDLKKKSIETKESEVIFILEKLIKDGFATREIRTETIRLGIVTSVDAEASYKVDVAYYLISFEGKVRIQFDKGYQGVLNNLNKEKIELEKQNIRQKRLQTKLNQLTAWIAIGTIIAAIYYLNELYLKGWFHWF